MIRLRIDRSFYLFTVMLLMLFPIKWVLAGYMAACIHECCHLAAIRILGGRIHEISVTTAGANINLSPMPNFKELLCAAAGPLGSFLLIIFRRQFPELAACGFIQGAYNMLPVYPLDGGRVVRCLMQFLFPDYTETVSSMIGILTCGILGIFAFRWKFWPAFLPLIALFRGPMRKIPCKEGKLAVQ